MKNYSILMSVYQKENPKWLKESIDSMLNQTIKTNDFVIIKDGKLTSELDYVLEKYKLSYPDIFDIIELKENHGLAYCLKIGIESCKNEYIARMDSDDIAVENRIEKQIEKLEEFDIVGSSVGEFEENINTCKIFRILPQNDEDIKKYCKRRNPFAHPSVMFKKSKVIEAGNYNENHPFCEDYDLWIRMIKKRNKCYNFKEILTYMRVNDEFYKRRGGIKYLKKILRFKKEQYKTGFYKFNDWIISSIASISACLIPNKIRKLFYCKFLRRSKKY